MPAVMRALRTTRCSVPPPPGTGFSTSVMSGYLAFRAANIASAASRSPGAVHQWKISSFLVAGYGVAVITMTCGSAGASGAGAGAGAHADRAVADATITASTL